VRWVAPDAPQAIASWLTHLAGSTALTAPMLTRVTGDVSTKLD
jgi:hypothetical protein